MKTLNVRRLLAPTLITAAFLISTPIVAAPNGGAMDRLITACEQELQTICSRLDSPNQAIMCLRENEPQLQTQACVNEVQAYSRTQNAVPTYIEEPFTDTSTNKVR